jgi:hypothetical protein
MAIQILPIIAAISELASTTWEIYRKTKDATGGKDAKRAQETLLRRVQELDDANLEQAQLISQLSKELEQFAQAVQEEFETRDRVEKRLRLVSYGALGVSAVALLMLLFLK